jgi:hypothetical protein
MRSAVATCSKTVSVPIDLDTVAAAPLFDALTSTAGTDAVIDGSRAEPIRRPHPQVPLAALSIWRVDEMRLDFSPQSLNLVAGLEHLGILAQHYLDRELSQ